MRTLLRRRRSIAAAVVTGLLAAPGGAQAAGTYDQHFCVTGYAQPSSNAWTLVSSAPASLVNACDPFRAYPYNGVYAYSAGFGEGHHMTLEAKAPPGARYRRIRTDLRIPYQSANRRTFIEDDLGYVWFSHQSYGGGETYNLNPPTIVPYDLRDSSIFRIGQACHGSTGSCGAGDFYLSYLVATLYDETAPTVSVAPTGLFDSGRTYHRGAVTISADLRDAGKGPQHASIEVDGVTVASDAWSDAVCNFRLPQPCADRIGWSRTLETRPLGDGARTVTLRVDDGLGNERVVSRTVTFDNTAPAFGPTPAFDGRSVTAASVRIPIKVSDATSGVARVEQAVDAGAWVTATADAVTVSGPGTHTVRLRAVDVAGNVSAERVVTFTLLDPPSNQRLTTPTGGVLPGAPGPGDKVACHVGSPWSTGTTFTYVWLRDGQVIDGAADQVYTVQAIDAGSALRCRVTAGNEAGSTVVTSPATAAGARPNYGVPTGGTGPSDDYDLDGVDNLHDGDDDNDGVPDAEDQAPFDRTVGRPAPSGGGASGSNGPTGSPGRDGRDGRDGIDARVGSIPNGSNHSLRAVTRVHGSRTHTLRNGAAYIVRGRLLDENGRPIGGAELTVSERVFVPNAGHPDGAVWVPVGTITSKPDGSFAYRAPAGQSRTVRIAYKAFRDAGEFAATSEVTLLVNGKATLKVDRARVRNGQKVTFSGRVLAGPLPSAGLQVELQALTARGWVTFRNARAKAGRFKASYRFVATTGTRTYAFRARVRPDSSYAYLPVTTKQVKVRVTGR